MDKTAGFKADNHVEISAWATYFFVDNFDGAHIKLLEKVWVRSKGKQIHEVDPFLGEVWVKFSFLANLFAKISLPVDVAWLLALVLFLTPKTIHEERVLSLLVEFIVVGHIRSVGCHENLSV